MTSAAAAIRDPNGRLVTLTVDRCKHIVDGHPELSSHLAEVLRAVQQPTCVLLGRRPGEIWYHLADSGPSRWL